MKLVLGPVLRHVGEHDATIWVETDEPCTVEILGASEHTWTVAGHHYALVIVTGLAAGTSVAYTVSLDGTPVWPAPADHRPTPRVRTLGGAGSLRIAFGSCRYARSASVADDPHFEADALMVLGRQLAAESEERWPHALLMLGDQVYADETTPQTQARIRRRRDITTGAKEQVADFEEYTWLYDESWTDPDVRWLMSVVPSSMIFDDHDIRDDWNTSRLWRQDIQRTDWWRERIIGGLSSYWVYQHLGNLAPADLAANELYQQIRTGGADGEHLLRAFAEHADAEADGAKGTRWSYRRDFGAVRLVMIDSRCGRILDEDEGGRSMVSDAEYAWIAEQARGDYDHLLIGTSLPWLLARALHDLEAWDESLAAGARGPRLARWAERLRRAADLEHWAAFQRSFRELSGLIRDVATGVHGHAPATVCVLSGDVHHAYVARAQFEEVTDTEIYQLTCSPLHNFVPTPMKATFRVAWSRAAERGTRFLLDAVTRVPRPPMSWKREAGPYFGNELMTLIISGRLATVELAKTTSADEQETALELVDRVALSSR
ncbi:alkaline phosphatase family protein [Jatrophihabitans telluris]|uniref:Alkaline phosphatase family protein n=1 Tax=Jatrophihabitans telluris TaxID=2038343 RepID=A0ABY4R0K4_9ACTN|nr:alkaline phosphatase D family protein [Jatrophihabitans telluris]UQX89042.1 alkaline phosphatase family protein [Jatrophihabitans telluris]